MSQREPTGPYVYQPDPPCPGAGRAVDQRIFGVAGPGAESLYGRRFTKAEAIRELNALRGSKPCRATTRSAS
ncbi:MAG: hypothetical protein U0791_26615 [Gemmataceae bacterium]